jgi:outer membrane protein
MRARVPLLVCVGLTVCVVSASAQALPANTQPSSAVARFPADARIAYVDLDRVAALSSAGKAAAAKIDELRSKRATELAERSKQVSALEQKMTQSAAVLNDDGRIRMQREYQRARVSFERLRDDAQAEVQDLQEELLRAFTARVFPVIGDVAKERKLWAVFSKEASLIWHDPAVDLTEEIARRLDARLQQ